MTKKLRNKPLVEALLELKWKLDEVPPGSGALRDPAYPIFTGRLYDRLKSTYPHIESLPSVHVPDELTPHVAKYRFRKTKDGWPLVQAGPGVATLNFTETYDWDTFLAASEPFFSALLDVYVVKDVTQRPPFTSIMLRYINAIEFSPIAEDLLRYLDQKFHTRAVVPEKILKGEEVSGPPQGLQLMMNFDLKTPRGVGSIRLGTGTKKERPALIWDLNITSSNNECPQNIEHFKNWLITAHDVAEKWFFALIEGDLERQFE